MSVDYSRSFSIHSCPAIRTFSRISPTWFPFSNRLKEFYLHLELPSDQENNNGFAAERLCLWHTDEHQGHPTTVSSYVHLKHFKQSRVLHFMSYNNSLKITVLASKLLHEFASQNRYFTENSHWVPLTVESSPFWEAVLDSRARFYPLSSIPVSPLYYVCN